jgi:hypothetical protein
MVMWFCKKLINDEQMESYKKQTLSVLLAIVLILALSLTACAYDEDAGEGNADDSDGVLMTITGKVNDDFQILSDEGVFEIDIEGEGSELIEKVGQRVEVRGYVIEENESESVDEKEDGEDEEEGIKTITVISYKLLETY